MYFCEKFKNIEMQITKAEFVISSVELGECPQPDLPEYAFIGRSNVGKSSLINMIVDRKNLAHTSAEPGKTQTINHFLINKQWYLVDLPGYGYAQRAIAKREAWADFTKEYLLNRKNLLCTFVLIDSRIPPQKIDLEFVKNLGENQIPFVIAFTKADKRKPVQLEKNMNDFQQEMLKNWEELPQCVKTSANLKIGRTEILNLIEETNKTWKEQK